MVLGFKDKIVWFWFFIVCVYFFLCLFWEDCLFEEDWIIYEYNYRKYLIYYCVKIIDVYNDLGGFFEIVVFRFFFIRMFGVV